MKYLFAAALLSLLASRPAIGQTARIAHLSHGGSLATLAPELDNFGEPIPYFAVDSVRLISDSTALEYGEWRWAWRTEQEKEKMRTHKFSSRQGGAARASARSYVEQTARIHPNLKVLSYDTLPSVPAPVPKKQKAKRKKAALLMPLPAEPPRPYGLWLSAAFILTLAGAGWLLSGPDQRPRTLPAHA
ncbi:hypothetical protein GCM10023185_34180 [Hymenobacter saemangeumensis]|uniref:Uncharacterized protein n=1 Tax=Hymenobacter saemangeumensis TaxID=1084522 RepID=A0ABP8INR5_9BACT